MNKYIWIIIWISLGIFNLVILYIKRSEWTKRLSIPYRFKLSSYYNYYFDDLAYDIDESILVFSLQYIMILSLYVYSVLTYWG